MFIVNTQPLVDSFIAQKIQRDQKSEALSFGSNLDRFLKFISERSPWVEFVGEIERKDVETYLVYLRTVEYSSQGQKAYRNNFVYRHLRALNKFLEYLTINADKVNEKHWPKAELIYKADFPSPNRRGVKHFPAWLDKMILQEIKALPETKSRQLRFKTIMMVIYHTGARIKDICTLENECLTKKIGYNWIRIFSNKTKRYYEVPINNEVHKYITAYKEIVIEYRKHLHPTTRQMVELMLVRRGTADGLRQSMGLKIKEFGNKVRLKAMEKGFPIEDIEELSLTSHKYRHNVGIKLIRMGADPLLVAEFLGHTNLAMAQAYLQEDEQEIEDVLNELIADDSLGLNTEGELLDSILVTKQEVIDHCGIVSKVDGGWCTHFKEHPPCGEAAYECWKCDSLRPDFEDEHYLKRLQALLEDHTALRERNIRKDLIGAAKSEDLVIARIQGFMEEVMVHVEKKKIV